MNLWTAMGVGAVVLAGGGVAWGHRAYRNAMAETGDAYTRLAAPQREPVRRFDPKQVADLPEIAQRYFGHAVAPGTPLYSVAELEMEGTFLLGDRASFQRYAMFARQVLRPPAEFVWVPQLRSGPVRITGSDALVDGVGWTRFWLMGAVPLANEATSPDLVRSAQFRAAVESALWLPTTLLPEHGARWMQAGPDEARVTLGHVGPAIELRLLLDERGAVKQVVGQRWSNANPEKRFRLQPFGGTVIAEATFQGLTIPAEIAVGNHFGTEDYLPFFQARIMGARYR